MRLAKALGVLALIAMLTLPLLVWRQASDPPFDDADLRPVRIAVADAENGRVKLDAIAAELWWPECERSQVLQAIRRGETWDEALVAELIERNAPALVRIPDALAAPHFQLRAFVRDEEGGWTAEESSDWWKLGRILALRAEQHARAGRAQAAFDDALLAVEIGRSLREADGATLLASASGIGAGRDGSGALARMLQHVEPEAIPARRWSDALASARTDRDAWSALWDAEYQLIALLIDDIAMQRNPDEPWRQLPYFFKPNATKALFADAYRHARRSAALPCEALGPYPVSVPESRWQKLRTYVGPNGIGKIFFHVAGQHYERYAYRRCAADLELEAVRVWIALRAYAAEHANTPATLAALVPAYLAEVPVDPFDGEPVHWDPAARILGRERAIALEEAPSRIVAPF